MLNVTAYMVVLPMLNVIKSIPRENISSSFDIMAVSALDVLGWVAIKFNSVQLSIIQFDD